MRTRIAAASFLVLLASSVCSSAGQEPVAIAVDPTVSLGDLAPIWTYFGYDEPNYTYTANGRKLVAELGALSRTPVYIRAHNLLTTGDGTPALKWGSTNAYTEDASGKPVYDWTISDRIFDTYLAAHAKPFVEIGFMPEALSIHPHPYKHTWPNGGIDTGWAYPPKDYARWQELIYQWAKHCGEKYGRAEAESWYWEVWNEPDILYWHGTPEEYNKLYDTAVAAVKRALPNAAVGGPASTGPAGAHAAEFLRQFLQHCQQVGAPLDFISFHAKGRPELVDGHVHMGIARQMQDIAKGFEIVNSFPRFRALPIVLSESDPEGCAACSMKDHPQNAYRNGPSYAAYTAAAMNGMLQLAQRSHSNLRGMLTWAFEFEDQPYFAGFRTLATNGIDKAVLNFFRLAGMLDGERIKAESSGALELVELLKNGASAKADIGALATRSDRGIAVLLWNYSDLDVAADSAPIALTVRQTGQAAGQAPDRVLLQHYRIDASHGNSFATWTSMGAPQLPTPRQYADLEAAAQLQLLEAPRWISAQEGKFTLRFRLPAQALSLIRLGW